MILAVRPCLDIRCFLQLLSKSLDEVASEEWVMALGSDMGAQIALYQNLPEEKVRCNWGHCHDGPSEIGPAHYQGEFALSYDTIAMFSPRHH